MSLTILSSKEDLINYILSNKITNVNPLSDICANFDDVNNLCRSNEQLVYKLILYNIGFYVPSDADDVKYNINYKDYYKLLHQANTTGDIIKYYQTKAFEDAILLFNQTNTPVTLDYIKFILKYSQSNNLCDNIYYICKVYNETGNNKLTVIVNYIIDELIPETVNKSNIITNIILQCIDLCDEKCNISNMIMSLITRYKAEINKSDVLIRIIQCDKVNIYEKVLMDYINVKKKMIENINLAIQCKAYNILNYIHNKIEKEYTIYLDQILQQIIDSNNEQHYKFFINYIFTINYINHYTTFLEKYVEKQINDNLKEKIPKFIKFESNYKSNPRKETSKFITNY
jgi:hypothetical protein